MPGDPGATVVTNARAYYHYTRGCGCNGHPAFPTPSLGRKIPAQLGRMARREGSRSSSPAKTGDPVFRGVIDGIEKLRLTGYSAFAEYDGICTAQRSATPPREPSKR